jgi:hypothetical protein
MHDGRHYFVICEEPQGLMPSILDRSVDLFVVAMSAQIHTFPVAPASSVALPVLKGAAKALSAKLALQKQREAPTIYSVTRT